MHALSKSGYCQRDRLVQLLMRDPPSVRQCLRKREEVIDILCR